MMNRNTKLRIATLIAGLLALFYIYMGVQKVMGEEEALLNFERWGYPCMVHDLNRCPGNNRRLGPAGSSSSKVC